MQIFTEEQAEGFSFDVLDATKIVPEELVPVHAGRADGAEPQPGQLLRRDRAGRVLHRAHRARASISRNDPLLAGRIHSYVDTQISRLGGPNFHEIPINAPVAQVHNNQRDGMHRQAINRGRVAYEPNSLGGGCPFQAGDGGLHVVSASRSTDDKVRGKPETLRRPLHAGDAVLEQPDAGRAGAHRRRRSASS